VNKLIITASPASTSFTHKISESYGKGSKEVWDDIQVVDLYDIAVSQPILQFEDKQNFNHDENRKAMQEKITWADEIVFIFPIWWWGLPGILKNFFDTNFESGFAFKYSKEGMEKLLVWKTAKVFCTCDAPWFLYKYSFLTGINMRKYIKSMILGFCGIKLTHFQIFDKMRVRDEENRKWLLKNVLAEAGNP
jgi:NAD(P)H dehydrogenase (quinone)